MKLRELEPLAKGLEKEAHLVVWQGADRFEVVALGGEVFEDAFPLPLHVQAAAAEVGMLLDTTTAARLEIEKMPEDFWEGLEETRYGERLRVSVLGRAGRKYLEVYHAVSRGEGHSSEMLDELELTEGELLKVARWLREQALFDHRSGDVIMKILTGLA